MTWLGYGLAVGGGLLIGLCVGYAIGYARGYAAKRRYDCGVISKIIEQREGRQ